jgi:hypothetical protein
VIAGAIGGVAISLLLIVAALARHQDVWIVFKGAAAPFLGERAARPGLDPGAVALGVLCHLAVSIVWGVLFAALFYGLSRGATLVAGALWGLFVWFGMYYVVLPFAGLERMAQQPHPGMTILAHVVFGLAVAIGFLPFQRTRPHLSGPITRVPAPY